jgi:CheY-like chemotaxis protein
MDGARRPHYRPVTTAASDSTSLSHPILVVEDDLDAQIIFADRLRWEGYEVICVSSGIEAWELLSRGFVPGLMVLDVMLPGMEGTELRRRMLRDKTMSLIPIIVVTAVSGMIRCVLPKVEAFFRKPVPLDDLIDVVARYAKPVRKTKRLPQPVE